MVDWPPPNRSGNLFLDFSFFCARGWSRMGWSNASDPPLQHNHSRLQGVEPLNGQGRQIVHWDPPHFHFFWMIDISFNFGGGQFLTPPSFMTETIHVDGPPPWVYFSGYFFFFRGRPFFVGPPPLRIYFQRGCTFWGDRPFSGPPLQWWDIFFEHLLAILCKAFANTSICQLLKILRQGRRTHGRKRGGCTILYHIVQK